jgi:hypothetical protein
MDENPYEAPQVIATYDHRDLRKRFDRLRTVVAILVVALGVQWCCHLLTALAMFGWMGMVPGAPTAKILDSVFYGFGCVAFTAALAIAVGVLGARSLAGTRDLPTVGW